MDSTTITDNKYSGNILLETEKEFDLSYYSECNIQLELVSEKTFTLQVKNFA